MTNATLWAHLAPEGPYISFTWDQWHCLIACGVWFFLREHNNEHECRAVVRHNDSWNDQHVYDVILFLPGCWFQNCTGWSRRCFAAGKICTKRYKRQIGFEGYFSFRVLHTAARAVLDLKPRDRVTPTVRELHCRGEGPIQAVLASSRGASWTEHISDLLTPVADVHRHDLHCVPHRAATSSYRGMSTNRRQSFLCCCTTCMEQAADRPQAAAVDRLVL